MKAMNLLSILTGVLIGIFVSSLDLPFLPSFGIMILLSAVTAVLYILLLVDKS